MEGDEIIKAELANIFNEKLEVYDNIQPSTRLKSALTKYKISRAELISVLKDEKLKKGNCMITSNHTQNKEQNDSFDFSSAESSTENEEITKPKNLDEWIKQKEIALKRFSNF